MSRTTQSTARRTLALASALVTAGLAAPEAAQAQAITSERTLLNRFTIASIGQGNVDAARTAPTDPSIPVSVNGERALLGRTPTRERQQLPGGPARVHPDDAQVDGKRALLGQWTRGEAEGVSP